MKIDFVGMFFRGLEIFLKLAPFVALGIGVWVFINIMRGLMV